MIEVRPIRPSEVSLLREFLYLAVYQPDPTHPIPRSVLDDPGVSIYTDDWGQPTDRCLVAANDGLVAGAVWTRILAGPLRGFGNLDAQTPEFSIAVLPELRGVGMGTQLMRAMVGWLAADGIAQASLSVQATNPARRLYERLGFEIVEDRGDEWIMVRQLQP